MSKHLDKWCEHLPDDLVAAFADSAPPVLFLGAGFGAEAVPPLKTGTDLAELLRAELHVTDHTVPLAELLQYYKNCHSRSDRSVRAWMEKHLNWGTSIPTEPGGAHHLLLRLPFRILLTTNYDDLLDRAALRTLPAGTWRSTTSIDDFKLSLSTPGSSKKTCAHVHGAFSASVTSPLVASTDDYIAHYLNKSSWLNEIEELIPQYRFLFIGYGMRDFTVWSSYFTAIMKHSTAMWPHGMVCPPQSQHDLLFWLHYNISFIPLLGYQFLIALSARLGLLTDEETAVCAAAACWKITPELARPQFSDVHRSLGYATPELTLRHIINETH